MAKFYESISPQLIEWALKQSMFWTGSAPLAGKHINVSPKGVLQSSFTIFGPNKAGYVDLTGSGAETIAHLYENGRITVMFNSFGKSPMILRFFCKGSVVEADDPRFPGLLKEMNAENLVGPRAVILLDVFKVSTSCGYGVPILSTAAGEDGTVHAKMQDRDTIRNWAQKQVDKGNLHNYQAENNAKSLDGLTGMVAARRRLGQRWLWVGNAKAWLQRAAATQDVLTFGMVVGAVAGALAMKTVPQILMAQYA